LLIGGALDSMVKTCRRAAARRPPYPETSMRLPLFRSLALSVMLTLSAVAAPAADLLEQVKAKVAADGRITLFEVNAAPGGAGVTLSGRVLQQSQKDAVLQAYAAAGKTVTDQIEVFPFAESAGQPYAVAARSLLNIRGEAKHASELVTQTLMGRTMRLLKHESNWWKVQLDDDGYIGWAEERSLVRLDEAAYRKWRNAKKVMVTQPTTDVLGAARGDADVVAKLYWTTMLPVVGTRGSFTQVQLPKGGPAFALDGAVKPVPAKGTKAALPQIVQAAKRMLGVPYLWGGTSPLMMDCSGLTQQVYRLQGYQLPRDADQQQEALTPVASRTQLRPGDLLFWPGHTGMYIGDGDFIHSSPRNGGVGINSFNPKHGTYDAWFIENYKGAGRVIL
jgi:cell wall-associated NlpC family hydrolase